jgi:CheY-like chemotaxis protein
LRLCHFAFATSVKHFLVQEHRMHGAANFDSEKPPLVLIVDDDELTRAALSTALVGFRTKECGSGKGALEYLRSGERPDLILLDLIMPDMDGWEFRSAQLDDATLVGIPVVALSGDKSPKARALHADAFLPKPIGAQLLLQTVAKVLMKNPRLASIDASEAKVLAQLGELLEETLAPIKLANDINSVHVEVALELVLAGPPDVSRLLFWLWGAREAGRSVSGELEQTTAFADRQLRLAQETLPRVLVVDHDDSSRGLLVEALRLFCGVNTAASAADAVRALTAMNDYDLVVCRLWMPSMTGADLLLSLAESHPEQAARILFLSGGSEREEREAARVSAHKHLGVQHGLALADVRATLDRSLLVTRH